MKAIAKKAVAVRLNRKPIPDSYFALVQKHPLTTIRNNRELDLAQKVIDNLLTQPLDEGRQAYLDAISDLVMLYERDVHPIDVVAPYQRLAHLLDSNGLSQADLARRTGMSKATISDLVTGKRPFTVEQMGRIGDEFALPASAFLPGRG